MVRLKNFFHKFNKQCQNPPRPRDYIILSVFTFFITLQPYFLSGEINFFELGLYLPGIDGVLKGLVPYKDLFHLRGPFELYLPALAMKVFGENVATLEACFYVGNVLALLLWILVGKKIFSTRLVYYLMTLVLITRTFPRVTFDYWGGFRYAWGAAVVALGVLFFKKGKPGALLWAGIFSVIGFFTSAEIGVCAMAAISGTLMFSYIYRIHDRQMLIHAFGKYVLGCLIVALPFIAYMASQQALAPMIESIWTVVSRMQKVIYVKFQGPIPGNPWEIFLAMVNPTHVNFKHVTPAYLYLFLGIYLFRRIRRKELETVDACLVCVGLYGLVMYNAAFRLIWASQFEMALQPEKILLFVLLERAYVWLDAKKGYHLLKMEMSLNKRLTMLKIYGVRFLIVALVMSSVMFALQRFNKRFFVFRWVRDSITGKNKDYLVPLNSQDKKAVNLPRVSGMTVPQWQAEDLEQLVKFVDAHTRPDEKVFMFPEMGAYYFVTNRQWVGRFPMVTFSWFNDRWHEEFVEQLSQEAPRYAFYLKDLGPTFPTVYFQIPENKEKFDQVDGFIKTNYRVIDQTPSFWIYEKK